MNFELLKEKKIIRKLDKQVERINKRKIKTIPWKKLWHKLEFNWRAKKVIKYRKYKNRKILR